MKEYKVKATRTFNDVVENKERKAGDTFNCTEERYLYLKEHNAVELVETEEVTLTINNDFNVPAEVLAEAIEKQLPKKKTSRKK